MRSGVETVFAFIRLNKMNKIKRKNKMNRTTRIPLLLIVGILAFLPSSFGEVQAPQEDALFQEIQRLKQLKVQDPAAYEQAIQQKKGSFLSSYHSLAGNQQKNFEEYLENSAPVKRQKLEEFRKKDPEGFRDYAKGRLRRFEEVKEKNPERYRNFTKNHPEFPGKLKKFGRNQFHAKRQERHDQLFKNQNSGPEVQKNISRPENGFVPSVRKGEPFNQEEDFGHKHNREFSSDQKVSEHPLGIKQEEFQNQTPHSNLREEKPEIKNWEDTRQEWKKHRFENIPRLKAEEQTQPFHPETGEERGQFFKQPRRSGEGMPGDRRNTRNQGWDRSGNNKKDDSYYLRLRSRKKERV